LALSVFAASRLPIPVRNPNRPQGKMELFYHMSGPEAPAQAEAC
jgi:hypothetical protein